MLHEERTDVSDLSPADLHREYLDALGAVVDSIGPGTVAERTGLDRDTAAAIANGDAPTIDLETAARVLALDDDTPDAETIHVQATEHLLLGMSMAVLDVDAVAADVDLECSPKEIQQKLERRAPTTLEEFATLEHFITDRRV